MGKHWFFDATDEEKEWMSKRAIELTEQELRQERERRARSTKYRKPTNGKDSRNQARIWRDAVINRSNLRCEICASSIKYISRVHHIIPVKENGSGHPENLIALCPNCHAVIHKAEKKQHSDWFMDWLHNQYTVEQVDMLLKIANRELLHDGRAWAKREIIND